ncbi:hypothetical protein K1719_026059 [Acacia pycnantha]|nr:hypothetical protein K1719_026059 [Acacia pycnantha]
MINFTPVTGEVSENSGETENSERQWPPPPKIQRIVNSPLSSIRIMATSSVRTRLVEKSSELEPRPVEIVSIESLCLEPSNPAFQPPYVASVTVSKDGGGNFTTINEVLSAVPKRTSFSKAYIIYVLAGVYEEYVSIDQLRMRRDLWSEYYISYHSWAEEVPNCGSSKHNKHVCVLQLQL